MSCLTQKSRSIQHRGAGKVGEQFRDAGLDDLDQPFGVFLVFSLCPRSRQTGVRPAWNEFFGIDAISKHSIMTEMGDVPRLDRPAID
jgi:hypothetical protein